MLRFEKWKPLILACKTEAELVRVMSEFCATFLPSELSALPRAQACRVESPEDIEALAVTFTTDELRAPMDSEAGQTLIALSRAFVLAAQQLRRLRPGPYNLRDPESPLPER